MHAPTVFIGIRRRQLHRAGVARLYLFGSVSRGHIGHRFSSINGISATLTGGELWGLSHNPHILSITPDVPVAPVGIEESGLWRDSVGANQVPSLTGIANLFVFLALIGPLIGARLAAGRAGFAAHPHGGSMLALLLLGLFGAFRRGGA